jgi:tetratricopeptide (TPR) repeat protein
MSSPAAPASSWPRLASVASALFLLLGACVDHAGEHRVRANAFLRGGDAAAALKECDDGLAGSKGDLALLILRGNALFELDRLDDAGSAYQAALDAGRDQAPRVLIDAHRGLAMVASRQKDWATARREFEVLIRIYDKDASSHLNVARACLELKDFDCAVHHAEEAGRGHGDQEPVLYTLGTIYLAAGKPADAKLTFQHICEVIPGAASCPYGLALVAAREGDGKAAIAQLDDAVRRKLPNPDQIAADPGFASIKDDPEFQKIVARAAHPAAP